MKKKSFSVALTSGLVLALAISAPLTGAAPLDPDNVKPSDYAKDVGLNPMLEAKVTDSAGASIETAEFLKGYTYDFSGSGGITGYKQITQENPLTGPALEGASAFSAADKESAAVSDSKSVVTKSEEGFPTQRFEVDVTTQLEAGSEIELEWEGYSPKGGIITLSAWDHQLGNWEVLKQGESDGDKIELAADIDQAKFLKNGKIQAMVHDSRTAPVPENDVFTMMWFTDTQFYTQDNPEVWTSMTDWMIEEYQKGTYEYAFHTGDLVQTVTKEEEWAIANENLNRMDEADIPYGVIAGNHDVVFVKDEAGNTTYDYSYFWKYAGADRFEGRPWYGGEMDNNRNHYDLFSFDGHDFIMLYLGYGMEGTPETVKWANDVLAEYADRNAILAIHQSLTPEKTYGNGESYKAHEQIVVPNENVKMVLSGHYQGAAHRVQVVKNPDGTEREVLEVLSNYQGGTKSAERGMGYLRLLNFNPADESVSFVTYSPHLDDYDFFDPAEDSFKANYDLNEIDSSKAKAAPVDRQVDTDYFAVNIYKKQQIGQKDKVKSGDVASVQWSGLKPSTQYFWYMNLTNAAAEVKRSEMYRFTTEKAAEPEPEPDPDPEYEESSTSRLGHLNSINVRIYENYKDMDQYTKAGTTYTHAVYYIKKQVKTGNELFYLISTSPSSTRNVVGWVNADDMTDYKHVAIDKTPKTFYIKGISHAYDTAWGGRKNISFENLARLKGEAFSVNLTEKVGTTLWYRGVIDGKTAWVRETSLSKEPLEKAVESSTSRLGHLDSSKVRIYKDYKKKSAYVTAGSKYTHTVYYIKKQAAIGEDIYFLISTSPSSTRNTVGWVNANDMTDYKHVGIDKKPKTLYIKGVSHAYDTAWGGRQNISFENLARLKGQEFSVNLTEKVGSTLWYRGVINGKTAWIRETSLSKEPLEKAVESYTSRLGHLDSSRVRIYDDYMKKSDYVTAGSKYTHTVYYIKKQAAIGGEIYFLISTSPSSTHNTVGWVKDSDMTDYKHVGIDKKPKTLYIKGVDHAYDTAWGGRQNISYENLSRLKGEAFEVNLTEKVGATLWYRGVIEGDTAWIRETGLTKESF